MGKAGTKKRHGHKVLNFSVCAKKCGLRPNYDHTTRRNENIAGKVPKTLKKLWKCIPNGCFENSKFVTFHGFWRRFSLQIAVESWKIVPRVRSGYLKPSPNSGLCNREKIMIIQRVEMKISLENQKFPKKFPKKKVACIRLNMLSIIRDVAKLSVKSGDFGHGMLSPKKLWPMVQKQCVRPPSRVRCI